VHVANVFAHDLATSHADWPGNKVDLACLTSLGLEERFGHWKQKLLTENRALPGRP
jgi:hypothetical protein